MTSDNVKAFRDAMNGLVAGHAAEVRAVEQSLRDTAAAADNSASEQVERAQKLVQRVQERSEALRKEEQKDRIREINYIEGDDEEEEPDPEVEQFAQQLNSARRAREQAEAAATSAASASEPASASTPAASDPSGAPSSPGQADAAMTSSTASSPPVRPRQGRFNRAQLIDDEDEEESMPQPLSAPKAEDVPARGWQAKAGRFGGAQRQQPDPSPAAPSDEPEESDVDEESAEELAEQQPEPAPDRRWQVRAGRFGKNSQPAPAREHQQQPDRPAPSERNPRPSEDEDDDEEDFSNRSWLR